MLPAPLRIFAPLRPLFPGMLVLLAACLEPPPREPGEVLCASRAPGDAADTLTVELRTDPRIRTAGRLLVRVDPPEQGPGPAPGEGPGWASAGLALTTQGVFRGCAGSTSWLVLGVPERRVEKAWLRVGSRRPVRVVAGEAAAVIEPGASGVVEWEEGAGPEWMPGRAGAP